MPLLNTIGTLNLILPTEYDKIDNNVAYIFDVLIDPSTFAQDFLMNQSNVSFFVFTKTASSIYVDWGDGSPIEEKITNDDSLIRPPSPSTGTQIIKHTYKSNGKYTIRVQSLSSYLQIIPVTPNNALSSNRMVGVKQWGTMIFYDMSFMFTNSFFLEYLPSTPPDLSQCKSMYMTFNQCKKFNADVSTWNTSFVKNMVMTFRQCFLFNRNLNTWNTSSVTDMTDMFNTASSFNQNISSWNVSQVTNMNTMFTQAAAFNQNLSSWNTGLTVQPYSFSFNANPAWVASKATKFPFLANGVTRINT